MAVSEETNRMKESTTPLQWIQHNRSRPARAVPAGYAIGSFVRLWTDERGAVPGRISEIVERTTDQAFRGSCSIVGIAQGLMTIAVHDASLVGWMKRLWRARLLQVITKEAGVGLVKDIRFVSGPARSRNMGNERE